MNFIFNEKFIRNLFGHFDGVYEKPFDIFVRICQYMEAFVIICVEARHRGIYRVFYLYCVKCIYLDFIFSVLSPRYTVSQTKRTHLKIPANG